MFYVAVINWNFGAVALLSQFLKQTYSDTYICCVSCRSFGVLLWEVMTRGSFPYSKLSDEEVVTAVCHDREKLPLPSAECPDRV